tara:strand:+ start:85110 stop:85790 length:681 start_codon:yes stop_codon:yes gene_type:complete
MWRALTYGVFPSLEHTNILSYLNKQSNIDFICDVGANKGQFSLATSYSLPKIKTVAFEPLLDENKIFKKIFKNNNLYTIVPKALGSQNKRIKINLTKKLHSSSILKPAKELADTFGQSSNKKTTANMVTLYDYFKNKNLHFKNGLLKIDVQGYELEVLKGSKEIINKFKYIIIELSNIELYINQPLAMEVIKFIEKNSYELSCTYNKFINKNNELVQADYLFKRIF